jgi:hypothetical protein
MKSLSSSQTLFVYYKIEKNQRTDWVLRVQAFQQRVLAAWTGLEGDLMQRSESLPEGMETWMEIYRHPNGVSDDIIFSIRQLASEMGLPGTRVAEVFMDLRPL